MTQEKIAVVLFNLGGPDKAESIRPFLLNFFMDKNIIRAPLPIRALIARSIANKRTKNEAGTSYGFMGGRSPLLENTQKQADALQNHLQQTQGAKDWKCFIAMRYWHPMSDETARAVAAYNPDRIVLVPLYPQFSTTTTWSSLQQWRKAADAIGLDKPESLLCCYPTEDGFVQTSAKHVRAAYDAAIADGHTPRILFSAHGLPEIVVKDGDPYQWQCEQTAAAIARAAGLENADWMSCYQSRVGRLKWIGPSTDEALEQAGRDKVGVIVYPHAFVSEHVETLVEIEIEYRHKADELGLPYFARVPTVMDAPDFIAGLARQIDLRLNGEKIAAHDNQKSICPAEFSQCCQRRGQDLVNCKHQQKAA
ncbi:ferrochelatase [Micavibrio aeruginosavorus]|uniref:Ferrochelatase n=1 Tax=Micavibrio aeruginosavorus EPB TaxID=349215 RepID=M4VEC0_9BACT|nr:ferrochelatase [Micavibrio aeruginosavorus]AGH96840.1 Ferrochelatase, protoheme ferro-lyase [Micavibrio aeruginosavorus EPB]